MDNQQIAADLFTAFEIGDMDTVRRLCAPEFKARQNLNNEFDVETLIQFSQAVSAIVDDFRYEEIIRSATDRGFVEEHTVTGTLPNGSRLTLAACVVADIENGKIMQLRVCRYGGCSRALRCAGLTGRHATQPEKRPESLGGAFPASSHSVRLSTHRPPKPSPFGGSHRKKDARCANHLVLHDNGFACRAGG